jgi:prophage regulatory protein
MWQYEQLSVSSPARNCAAIIKAARSRCPVWKIPQFDLRSDKKGRVSRAHQYRPTCRCLDFILNCQMAGFLLKRLEISLGGDNMNQPSNVAVKAAAASSARPAAVQQVIRISELASTPAKLGKLPVSRATVWRWVREGKFPKPFKLGESVTVWDLAAVDAFIERQAGRTQ